MTFPMDLAPDVSDALASRKPVVALESTIISHGMPFPRNIETARAAEAAIRESGATPATIAVLDGRIRIGISDAELERLGDPDSDGIEKLSRRDLAACLATGGSGATTVAATMICANLAGIRVFATGGIGGVHRGAELNFDISADLQELAQTPVTVVCAGAKAILDIPKTLEVLETLGVPVLSFGQDLFPAFWSRWHPDRIASPGTVSSTGEIADRILMSQRLGLKAGHLVANPIPETDEIPGEVIGPIIEQSLKDAEANPDISGKRLTPFLLDRVFALTEGRSLDSNIALVLNNARLAAKIAADLCDRAGNK
ncbi:pseudouridine-5'-phosphate glycosidase [Silicimonas sp. MF1-12-2]|uniref:pseudouridine-5'-phosphate glycosidase n=1 Tax=Silicimonas sp. MF1-12-2 TaxID=3384793 RepID=UPI0039B6D616